MKERLRISAGAVKLAQIVCVPDGLYNSLSGSYTRCDITCHCQHHIVGGRQCAGAQPRGAPTY